jgi:hypothetical protein
VGAAFRRPFVRAAGLQTRLTDLCSGRLQTALAGVAIRITRLTTTPSPRAVFQRQHQVLLLGLFAFWVLVGAMMYFGAAPVMRDFSTPPGVAAVICAVPLLLALLWARSRVPRRNITISTDDYWKDARVNAGAALVLFLTEGSATLAAVWTLLTGDWLCVLVSALSIGAMAYHGPAYYEGQTE